MMMMMMMMMMMTPDALLITYVHLCSESKTGIVGNSSLERTLRRSFRTKKGHKAQSHICSQIYNLLLPPTLPFLQKTCDAASKTTAEQQTARRSPRHCTSLPNVAFNVAFTEIFRIICVFIQAKIAKITKNWPLVLAPKF